MKVQILGLEEEQLQTRPTSNVEAHDLLMLAREANGHKRTINLTQRVIELNPPYVDAYIFRGFLAMASWYQRDGGGIETALGQCEISLGKARELMGDAVEMSFQYHWLNGICLRQTIWLGRGNPDMERAMEAAFKKAVELNPSASTPYISYAIYLRWENRTREAEDQIRKSLELDRLYPGAMYHLARVLQGFGGTGIKIFTGYRVQQFRSNQ